MPLTMLCTAVAGIAGMIFPPAVAQTIGWPAKELLGFTNKAADWFATAPGANFGAALSPLLLVVSYAVILSLIYIFWRKTHYNFREENIVE